jgi:hypothetical protein
MTRRGPGSRVLIGTCAYAFVAVSVVGGAFSATMALTTTETTAVARRPAEKIGPGYARIPPADLGKPEKVAYSTSYYPPREPRPSQPTPLMIVVPATLAPPMVIAQADRSTDSRPDIHRAY